MNKEGKIYVTYEIDNRKYRSVWDASIGKHYILNSLANRGATNVVVFTR